jgi:membrane protease YdiL (CAAX protease family)
VTASARAATQSTLLGAGLAAAVATRVLVGAPGAAASPVAGLLFGTVLAVLAVAAGIDRRIGVRAVTYGAAGAVVLCAPVAARLLHGWPQHRPAGGFLAWAAVVAVVAVAEEALLRGALFTAVQEWLGPVAAVVVTSLAFAGLHVPLYGWSAAGVDAAVGAVLGTLRVLSGSWTAPAVAHVAADLAGWWIR